MKIKRGGNKKQDFFLVMGKSCNSDHLTERAFDWCFLCSFCVKILYGNTQRHTGLNSPRLRVT